MESDDQQSQGPTASIICGPYDIPVSYSTVEELIAANPDKALAVGNQIVNGGEGTHWLVNPDGTMSYYWSKWVDGRIVPQNWKPEENEMDDLEMIACLRAAGSLLVPVAKEILARNPQFTEPKMLAAEDVARKTTPSAGGPGTSSPPVENAPAPTTPALPMTAVFLAAAQAAALAGAQPDYYTPEQRAALSGAKPQQLGWRDGGMDGSIPYHFLSDFRIDDIVPAGTPGTVTMPVTGHVLSKAKSTGENFFGYCQRVIQQATNGKAEAYMASLVVLQIGGGIGATDDVATWPQAADRFFNMKAYMTPAELAAAESGWANYTISRPGSVKPQPTSGSGSQAGSEEVNIP